MSDDKKLSQNEIDLRDKAIESATDGEGPKISRFLTGDNDPQRIKQKEREKRTHRLVDLLNRLATSEEKAAFVSLLDDFQSRLDQAFDELEEWHTQNEQRTARLEDGTAIYRMNDGQYCTADKRIIPQGDLPADIPKNALTLEEHEAYLRRAKQLAGMQDEIIMPGYELAQNPDATVQDIEDFKARIREAEITLDDPSFIQVERGFEATSEPAEQVLFQSLPPTP